MRLDLRQHRETWLAWLPMALVMAAIAVSAPQYSFADGQLALATISEDEALATCRRYAAPLGIDRPLEVLEVESGLGDPFFGSIMVGTDDGEHKFRVDQFNSAYFTYRNHNLMEDINARRRAGEKHPSRIVDRWVPLFDRLAPDFTPDMTRYILRAWREVATQWVLSGNHFGVVVDTDSGRVCYLNRFRRAVSINTQPRLTRQECRDIALNVCKAEATDAHVWAEELSGDREDIDEYFYVRSDAAGVQRLVFDSWITVSDLKRHEWEQLPENEQRRHGHEHHISVDARTGEWINRAYDPFISGTVDGEESPVMLIEGDIYGEHAPVFPPRIRNGGLYLYIGYFQSYLWPGKVEASGPEEATIEYGGKSWRLTAGRRVADVDGGNQEFPTAPLAINGYLHLPVEIVEAISGWNVTYLPGENLVKLDRQVEKQDEKTDGE